MTVDHTPKVSTVTDTSLEGVASDELATPTSWVHMDVLERDKMEWMTEVSAVEGGAPTVEGGAPVVESTNEMRFSLEGLVIPRATLLPTHLGLHHHGNDPQVSDW